MSEIKQSDIIELRERIKEHISGKRYSHTLAVESEMIALCRIFSLSEQDTLTLQAAALLHDITKEKYTEEQIALCNRGNIPFGEDECASPKVFHSITAEVIIKECFPEYATEEILSPVRYHTTGRENMTLGEKLLYLADYIEATRTFPDCVKLRQMFYSVPDPSLNGHLDRILILSFQMTISNLLEENSQIHPKTVYSMNSLLRNNK